ncbi:hypothetical protein [Fimbriimonas ginsengisoli]|nr:hypothetical protein [Fimbriimonas ginsengisoli]
MRSDPASAIRSRLDSYSPALKPAFVPGTRLEVIKYDTSGNQIWATICAEGDPALGGTTPPPHEFYTPGGIAKDSSGNVWITGTAYDTPGISTAPTSTYTVELNPSTGAILTHTGGPLYYSGGQADHQDKGLYIAADGANVYSVGTHADSGSGTVKYQILAYTHSTGFLAGYLDSYAGTPRAVAAASSGNGVLVAGKTPNGTYNDIFAARYVYSSGSITKAFTATYNDASNNEDYATGIALGSSYIFVTGYTYATGSPANVCSLLRLPVSASGTASFTVINSTTFGSPSVITADSSDNAYVAMSGAGITTRKYTSSGTQVWSQYDDETLAVSGTALGIALAGSTVYVGGVEFHNVALAYLASDGTGKVANKAADATAQAFAFNAGTSPPRMYLTGYSGSPGASTNVCYTLQYH